MTPPPSSPVTTATVFTFPSETSYTSIPVVRLSNSYKCCLKQFFFFKVNVDCYWGLEWSNNDH